MTQVTREYSPAKGATFGKQKAQIYGEFLESLSGDLGELTPREVVSAASPKGSPIHECFQWDNKRAATAHRLHQARQLLSHLKVRIISETSDEDDADMFTNVRVVDQEEDEPPRKYAHMRRVLSVDDYREQAVRKALRELEYWRAKYAQLARLTPLREAIDREVERLSATG